MNATKLFSSILVCNPYDSRKGSHSYAMWTTGEDYCFIREDGTEIWLQSRVYDGRSTQEIPAPAEKKYVENISWEDVPKNVKECLFFVLFPQGTEDDKNIFVLGEEEGKKLNEKLAWARANTIFSEAGTLLLMEEIGRWDRAHCVRSVSHWVGTGYKTYYYQVIVGKKNYEAWFEVTGPDSFSWGYREVDLKAEKAAKREYYFKVKSLADEAGVPWAIASLLRDKDGDRKKNIDALAEARQIHFSTLDEDTVHELNCGIDRRLSAISDLLIRSERFDLNGQVKSRRLAYYLMGSQEDNY